MKTEPQRVFERARQLAEAHPERTNPMVRGTYVWIDDDGTCCLMAQALLDCGVADAAKLREFNELISIEDFLGWPPDDAGRFTALAIRADLYGWKAARGLPEAVT